MAWFCRNPRLIVSKFLISSRFSTQTPPFPTFRAAKSAIVSESNPEKLADIFAQCSKYPTFCRHRPLYHLSIRKLSRAGRLDLVEKLLQTQKSSLSDSPMLNSEGFWIRLMMLYSSTGLVDQAMKTFDDMRRRKVCQISEKSLCAVLSVYMNNGMFDKVHEVFDKMPRRIGVQLGLTSHNLVLKTFVKEDKVDMAKSWIKKMEKDGKVMPDIKLYNMLLGAYLNKGDFSGFDLILKQILNKGLECNLTAYNYRISRLCKNKECARAKKLLDEMISKDVKPNSSSYNTIIDKLCQIGDFESAMGLLEKMRNDGYVKPCSLSYFTLIRNMVKEGEFESALEVSKEIIKRKWVPPFEAMEGLVNGLVKMSRVNDAKDIVGMMRKRLKGAAVDSWGKIEAALPL